MHLILTSHIIDVQRSALHPFPPDEPVSRIFDASFIENCPKNYLHISCIFWILRWWPNVFVANKLTKFTWNQSTYLNPTNYLFNKRNGLLYWKWHQFQTKDISGHFEWSFDIMFWIFKYYAITRHVTCVCSNKRRKMPHLIKQSFSLSLLTSWKCVTQFPLKTNEIVIMI